MHHVERAASKDRPVTVYKPSDLPCHQVTVVSADCMNKNTIGSTNEMQASDLSKKRINSRDSRSDL